MKHAFIREHLAGRYPLKVCCRVLGLSRSGYYHALRRPIAPRRIRRELLVSHVRRVHVETRGVYGSPRLCRELRRRGVPICRNTAATIMRESGLRSRRCRRFRPRTTDSSRTIRPAPNRLRSMDPPARPGVVWAADITYIRTAGGFVYLAAVMDLFSRRIVGWALDDHLRVSLVQRALRAAAARHPPAAGLVHHSDRGIQYDSVDYRALLGELGMVQSMSRKGDCYDNAAMESFFATLKTELVGDTVYADLAVAHDEIFRFIEGFYNHHRLHSGIGYRTPAQTHDQTPTNP
ncbi:MAG: IS3 family transposase [Phycisphaeraceae bacterium]|nr:IS3 family transposase [Phycisphaeraceae bacterium]